jgi:hypothetical protein
MRFISIVATSFFHIYLLLLSSLSLAQASDSRNPAEFLARIFLGFGRDQEKGDNVQTEFKLIGAGFARTGTSSTKKALEQLGYKVFHMEDVIRYGLGMDLAMAIASDLHFDRFIKKTPRHGLQCHSGLPRTSLESPLGHALPQCQGADKRAG